ncbi:hypothetical protein PFISCL1PPCAC_12504 [Pristionchus fissidentatus]|uniref:Uncharacterized protein n=1 Tax=Pristionchus fissidentatus TaxID=1538716 RepID=A0AAV5VT70_9BILA|nr:hypothetical protein PFISCL1PPCAC_12504 [Pristionchus fissidentatus]
MSYHTINLTIVKPKPPPRRTIPVASEELSEAQLIIGGTVVFVAVTVLVFYFMHYTQTYKRKMKESPAPALSREQVA